MSTERKLLRSIVAMETSTAQPPHLPTLMTTLGVSSMEFRDVLTQLFRKGYVNTDWQPTEAGKRVVTRPLGQVLLRRQPTSRQTERSSNTKTPRKVFAATQKRMPVPPLSNKASRQVRSNRNAVPAKKGPPPLAGQQRTPPPLPVAPPPTDAEYEVRESEVEELKPRR